MEKQLLSPNSAAEALDVSRSTIYAMMKAGIIKFVSVGADRRIPADEIKRIASEGAGTKAACRR